MERPTFAGLADAASAAQLGGVCIRVNSPRNTVRIFRLRAVPSLMLTRHACSTTTSRPSVRGADEWQHDHVLGTGLAFSL